MIRTENMCKVYGDAKNPVRALDKVSMQINRGDFAVIQGPSGSGKTTLLMALGGMLRPTSGTIIMSEKNLYNLSASERAAYRSQNIGFVFQMFFLLPYLNALENVLLAAKTAGDRKDKLSAMELLNKLDLAERMYHKPAALSAGEKQRAALARAMLNKPSIILADEPTGNLDPQNAETVMGVLKDFNNQGGTVIVVTHGGLADQYASKTIRLNRGKIVD